jgi:hypothetical protein
MEVEEHGTERDFVQITRIYIYIIKGVDSAAGISW